MQAAASAAVDPALLPAEASARARAVAERQAKTAVDRSGRQRIEERLAEVVIRNVRAQRNRARKERQVQRDGAARQALARQALLLARQATGRTAEPSPPAQQQQEGAAATVPSTASAHMPHSSPFALAAASSGECELAAPANDHTTPPSFATPLASGVAKDGGVVWSLAGAASSHSPLLAAAKAKGLLWGMWAEAVEGTVAAAPSCCCCAGGEGSAVRPVAWRASSSAWRASAWRAAPSRCTCRSLRARLRWARTFRITTSARRSSMRCRPLRSTAVLAWRSATARARALASAGSSAGSTAALAAACIRMLTTTLHAGDGGSGGRHQEAARLGMVYGLVFSAG